MAKSALNGFAVLMRYGIRRKAQGENKFSFIVFALYPVPCALSRSLCSAQRRVLWTRILYNHILLPLI